MRFLVLTWDYPDFLRSLYRQHRGLQNRPYSEQLQRRIDSLFGGPFFYSANLRKLGHDAADLYVNNEFMQKAWAREHDIHWSEHTRWGIRLRRGLVPWICKTKDPRWCDEILAAQIRDYRPDVVLNQAMDTISPRFLRQIKPDVGFLMGEHASPLPKGEDYSCYDLCVSSLPDLVEYFRDSGIPAELLRLAFGPEWLSTDLEDRPFDITFVGNFYSVHSGRVALVEALCARFPRIRVWAPGVDQLPRGSSIRKCYQGPAWGRAMYEIFARSKITLNNHGDFAPYANNGRLYEATGMGALLVTDFKENLHEMFEPGKEVVTYRSTEECMELIDYYLAHENERKAIARAGRERTMRQHTYSRRITDLVDIVSRYR